MFTIGYDVEQKQGLVQWRIQSVIQAVIDWLPKPIRHVHKERGQVSAYLF
jgi:hypothetical protein